MDPGFAPKCIIFWGWITEKDRMDPGISSICIHFFWGGDELWRTTGWILDHPLCIYVFGGELWLTTGWTLDFPLYISNLLWVNYGGGQDGPGIFLCLDTLFPVSLNSLPLLFACFLKEIPFYWKGQCHEIFDFRLFLRISFPQAPENTIKAVSNWFENSQRYSPLKLHHRVSLTLVANEIIFYQKSFNYFLELLCVVELTCR
jgi:hypothetical protein